MLYVGFPLWWALGLAQIIFFAMAIAMVVILHKQKESLRVPHGFALWLLFLIWMFAGLLMVRAVRAGHRPRRRARPGLQLRRLGRAGTSPSRSRCSTSRTLPRELPTQRIVRLLGWMFVVTAGFGVLAVLMPTLEFPSLMELVLPKSVVSTNFVRTLVHPSLSSSSDFLGYVQPRPTAPFPYSNAWGNNIALYLPFFMLGVLRPRDAGWRRKVGPVVLVAAVFPIIFSLNRGLWISLALAAVYAAVRLAVNGRTRALQALVAALLVGGIVFVSSPLYDTVVLRIETPHSNDRRAGTAETVVAVAAQGSPIVGLRHHPHDAGQLQLAGGWRDLGLPPVRGAAARHPGLHVAAGAHHRLRRHDPLPGVLRGLSSCDALAGLTRST